LKAGDKVRVWNFDTKSPGVVLYTIIDVEGDSVKALHPEVSGYFIFSAESVCEVVGEVDDEEG